MTVPDNVYTIMQTVRSWAEVLALRFHFPEDLCGLCAITARRLHRDLLRAGYDTRMAINAWHAFVVYEGRLILDVTATQFGREPLLVMPLEEARKAAFGRWWDVDRSYRCERSARRYLRGQGWDEDQLTERSLNRLFKKLREQASKAQREEPWKIVG